MFANRKVLFLFAHMDDEAISSYGTIRRAADEGADVIICCACGNGRAGGVQSSCNAKRCRRDVFDRHYCFARRDIGTYNDLSLTQSSAQALFDEQVRSHRPDIVITHSVSDLHFEHRFLGYASLVSCRRSPNCSVRQLLHVSSPTEAWTYGRINGRFTPNCFVDIEKYKCEKQNVLNEYAKCELPDFPDLRSVESIMQYDCQNGRTAGLNVAEAYCKVFEVV